MTLAECSIAIWVFALLTLLACGISESQDRLLSALVAHDRELYIAAGSLERYGRMLAKDESPPRSSIQTIGNSTFSIHSQFFTVNTCTYLRSLSVIVSSSLPDGSLSAVSLSTLQAVNQP